MKKSTVKEGKDSNEKFEKKKKSAPKIKVLTIKNLSKTSKQEEEVYIDAVYGHSESPMGKFELSKAKKVSKSSSGKIQSKGLSLMEKIKNVKRGWMMGKSSNSKKTKKTTLKIASIAKSAKSKSYGKSKFKSKVKSKVMKSKGKFSKIAGKGKSKVSSK